MNIIAINNPHALFYHVRVNLQKTFRPKKQQNIIRMDKIIALFNIHYTNLMKGVWMQLLKLHSNALK